MQRCKHADDSQRTQGKIGMPKQHTTDTHGCRELHLTAQHAGEIGDLVHVVPSGHDQQLGSQPAGHGDQQHRLPEGQCDGHGGQGRQQDGHDGHDSRPAQRGDRRDAGSGTPNRELKHIRTRARSAGDARKLDGVQRRRLRPHPRQRQIPHPTSH